jgi:hypothetical protein
LIPSPSNATPAADTLPHLFKRSYAYDETGRPTRIQDSGKGEKNYRYDPAGRLTESPSPLGRETFAFDPAGIQKYVGSCVRKIRIIFLLGLFMLFSSIIRADCTQEINLPLTLFKGHAVFVWKEGVSYRFKWMINIDALIPRESVVEWSPVVSECSVEARINEMKGLRQGIFLYLIENPSFPSFLDEQHNPMRPEEEFYDLVEKLGALAEKNQVSISFLDIKSKIPMQGF